MAAKNAASSESAAKVSAESARDTFIELKLSKWDKQPHKYTIVLSVLSLLLTLCAIGFTASGYFKSIDALKAAQDSLDVSQKSLHVGQRAYLAVKEGKLRLDNQKIRPNMYDPKKKNNKTHGWSYTNPKDATRTDWRHLRADFSFNIENTGNSPATIASLTFTPRMPNGWGVDKIPAVSIKGHLVKVADTQRDSALRADSGQEIEPHSTVFFEADPPLLLKDLAADYQSQKFEQSGEYNLETGTFYFYPNERFAIQGDLVYRDIFGESHLVHWCWAHTYLSIYPNACTPTEAALPQKR
jgi:hypothetical protein